MSHSTEIVEVKKLSNGQISALIRCCGNASTDHWVTMAVEVAADSEERKAYLESERQKVADQHEASHKATDGLINEVSALPVTHE
jgi:hypothetical protein